jgi:hypothetical protein
MSKEKMVQAMLEELEQERKEKEGRSQQLSNAMLQTRRELGMDADDSDSDLGWNRRLILLQKCESITP